MGFGANTRGFVPIVTENNRLGAEYLCLWFEPLIMERASRRR